MAVKTVEGREESTTANRLELLAAAAALDALRPGAFVTVGTPSDYVAKGIREWLPKWRANGWRTSSKKPVQNADLWQQLEAAVGRHEKVTWEAGQRQ